MEEEEDATFTVHDVLDAMGHLTPMYRAVFNSTSLTPGHQETIAWESVLEPRSRTWPRPGETFEPFVDNQETSAMPNEHPFDSKLKQQFEQFQPDVEAD